MNIKIAISSHIDSFSRTFDMLVESLLKSGVNNDSIYFFIGGYDKYENVDNKYNVNKIRVDHNSMDFTGLISIIDMNIDSDYWFLLHDTTYVGDRFYESLNNMNYTKNTIKMTNDGRSMNIGSYKFEYLISKKDEIIKFKNKDYSNDGLQRIKRINVDKEDFFFEEDSPSYNSSLRVTNNPIDFYGNGVNRIIEYYSDIDLYKIKANWYGRENYEIKL